MKKVVLLGIALSVSASVFAGQALAASYETEVKYGVNFRLQPSTDSSVLRLIRKGEDIHVIEQINDYWLKIEDRSGKVGYISAKEKYTDYNPYVATAKRGVNFRSQPKVTDNKIGFISKGDTVEVIEEVNSYWLKVNYNGNIGYTSTSYFDYDAPAKPKPDATASEIIATAKSYLGDFDYKFGAEPWTTDNKYSDCSAFVQLVFNKDHGYDLPRTSIKQSKEGTYVAKSNLKPGDLVFFDTNGDGTINHDGIYIGNGEFIHSAPSNDVGINNLNSGYWEDHYVTARSVL